MDYRLLKLANMIKTCFKFGYLRDLLFVPNSVTKNNCKFGYMRETPHIDATQTPRRHTRVGLQRPRFAAHHVYLRSGRSSCPRTPSIAPNRGCLPPRQDRPPPRANFRELRLWYHEESCSCTRLGSCLWSLGWYIWARLWSFWPAPYQAHRTLWSKSCCTRLRIGLVEIRSHSDRTAPAVSLGAWKICMDAVSSSASKTL